jgi:hypothetical protein
MEWLRQYEVSKPQTYIHNIHQRIFNSRNITILCHIPTPTWAWVWASSLWPSYVELIKQKYLLPYIILVCAPSLLPPGPAIPSCDACCWHCACNFYLFQLLESALSTMHFTMPEIGNHMSPRRKQTVFPFYFGCPFLITTTTTCLYHFIAYYRILFTSLVTACMWPCA